MPFGRSCLHNCPAGHSERLLKSKHALEGAPYGIGASLTHHGDKGDSSLGKRLTSGHAMGDCIVGRSPKSKGKRSEITPAARVHSTVLGHGVTTSISVYMAMYVSSRLLSVYTIKHQRYLHDKASIPLCNIPPIPIGTTARLDFIFPVAVHIYS